MFLIAEIIFQELSTPVTGRLVSGNKCTIDCQNFRALKLKKIVFFQCLNVDGVVFGFKR